MPACRTLLRSAELLLLMLSPRLAAATPVRIENVAVLSFSASDTDTPRRSIVSNRVVLDVIRMKTPTTLSYRTPPGDFAFAGLGCDASNGKVLTAAPLTAAEFAASPPLRSLDVTHALVVELDDAGGNRDPSVRETVFIIVSSPTDTESIVLRETSEDSGIFAGALPPGGSRKDLAACDFTGSPTGTLTAEFPENEYSLGTTGSLLIDPEGYVFDSTTGATIDGVEVTLVDDATGAPAQVFGEDGISAYPSTVTSGAAADDSRGHHYAFAKGNFRFPLVAPGRYRLAIKPPAGYSAPSSVPKEALEQLSGARDRYILAPASYGQAFALDTPDPVTVDVPIDSAPSGALVLEKTSPSRIASPGDIVQFHLRVTNRDAAPSGNVAIRDILPPGLRYRNGSTRGAPEPLVSADGRTLEYKAQSVGASEAADLTYLTEVAPGAPVGEAVNRATAYTVSRTSNVATASVRLRKLLFTDAMTIVGRISEGACGTSARDRIGVPGIRLLLDDGTFVVSDRNGLYHIEGARTGRHVVQLDLRSVPGALLVTDCSGGVRRTGSAFSQFVEGSGGSIQRADFQLRRVAANAAATAEPLPIVPLDDASAAGNRPSWLAGQEPGIEWLFPAVDHNPRAPAVRVAIKHAPDQRVALTVNGARADPLAFDGTDADGSVAVSRWSGLPLHEGDNVLEARILGPGGAVVATLHRSVHYANTPLHADYLPTRSRLVADGLTRPLIAVRVTDRDGRPVRAGTPVPFAIDAPYRSAAEALARTMPRSSGQPPSLTAQVVGDDGIAFVALEPTMQAGAAHLRFRLTQDGAEQTSDVRAWLTASAQGWTVVGFGAGSLGFETLRTRSRPLPGGRSTGIVTSGQASFYAKGRIKGRWLLTMAYDSARRPDPDRGLLSTIDPERYYTVYGDGTQQGCDASTSRKLYLRLENRAFYALFGDFETGLLDTQLTRYSRTLNGTKARYEGRRLAFSGFAARSGDLYGRDEIQGLSLSGPYRLSARSILPNSDKIRLEIRNRFRSENILETKPMARHIDYDIDPDTGTITFRTPVPSRDEALNPVFIVAEYETLGGTTRPIGGGRGALRLAGGRVELGASYVRDAGQGEGAIGGIDLKARLAPQTEIRAEAANGGRYGIGKGQAWLGELEHHGARYDLSAYARQQDADYGLGQQNIVEAGTRKLGGEGRLRLGERFSLAGSVWHQDALDRSAERQALDARLEYRSPTGTLFGGVQLASDRRNDGSGETSRLLTVGGTRTLLERRLDLGAQTQLRIGGKAASADFPVRHQFTASYRLTDSVRLVGSEEIARGAAATAHNARIGFDVVPWTGAKLSNALDRQAFGENAGRTFAVFGLHQSLPIGEHWSFDASLDASRTLRGHSPAERAIDPFQPLATVAAPDGNRVAEDFRSVTFGANYAAGRWRWNARVEHRDADSGTRWGLIGNLARSLEAGATVGANVRAFRIADAAGAVGSTLSASASIAWRKPDIRWSVLERLELRTDHSDPGIDPASMATLGFAATSSGDQQSTRYINNLALNYSSLAAGRLGYEASLYYGTKFIRGRFGDDPYTGFIDVIGFELHRALGPEVEVGIGASRQHAWTSHVMAWSVGPSIGLSPKGNSWISFGYNLLGYRDRDAPDARYTRRGPYVTMRVRFDQIGLGLNASAKESSR